MSDEIIVDIIDYDGKHKSIIEEEPDILPLSPENELEYAGSMYGPGDPVGIDEYESKMFWAPDDHRDSDLWIAAATIGPSFLEDGKTGRIYWNREKFWVNDYTAYHERGHNLRLNHNDGGIMNYDKPDVYKKGLHDATRTVVENSDGVHMLDWSKGAKTLRQAFDAWKKGHITSSDLRYCMSQWRSGAGHVDIYSDGYIGRQIEGGEKWGQAVYTTGIYREKNATRDGTHAWR